MTRSVGESQRRSRLVSFVWRVAGVAAVVLAVWATWTVFDLSRAGHRDAVDTLRRAPAMTVSAAANASLDDGRTQEIEFSDRHGPVRAWVRAAPPGAHPVPAVVILGGLGTGRRAVTLVDPALPYVVAALDYAWTGPGEPRGLDVALRLPAAQRDLMRTAVALRDLVRWLRHVPGVAGGHVYVLGASLGAPLAAAAAATEPPAGLVLLYGFADHETLMEYRLRGHVRWPLLRSWLARLGAALTANLDAKHLLPRMAGTPVLIVSSAEDRYLPRRCTELLWESAREPRTHIVLAGDHIKGDREADILRAATAAVVGWLAERERAAAGS